MRRTLPVSLLLLFMGFLLGYAQGRLAPVEAHSAALPDIKVCGTSQRVDVGSYLVCAVNTIYAEEQATKASVPEVAWSKAGDRITQWEQDSSAYKDRWFYDQIYLRWRIHECRNGQPITVPCPPQAGGAR